MLVIVFVWLLVSAPFGHAQVSPNNEWGTPAGTHAGRAPLGWVLVIHGGGWQVIGKSAMQASRPFAQGFQRRGWGTYNIDYRAGTRSLPDVLSAYDLLRRRVGRDNAICAYGQSAGGHLAMMLAAFRPRLDCVISEGGPTDLVSFRSQTAWTPSGLPATTGPEWVYQQCIVPSFGSSMAGLRWWSPVRWASRIRARMLLGASTQDMLVPQEQMTEMRRVRPEFTRTMLLDGAWLVPANFTHTSVTPAALARWKRAESGLLGQTHRAVLDRRHASSDR